GLRNALLGYLSEVETALRDRLGVETLSPPVYTSSLPEPSTGGLRKRAPPATTALADTNLSLLQHLTSLREDVLAYLPHKLPLPALSDSEWLRSLPSKLSVVDLALENQLLVSQKQKVIEVVHALLPSEEWHGWEKLGWEDKGSEDVEEGGEDEPEYLFPNRTPASVEAWKRRRTVRSKSVGASHFAFYPPGRARVPLHRSVTEGHYGKRRMSDSLVIPSSPVISDDEVDAEEIIASPELADTKLTLIQAESMGGPTVAEALAKSEDGKMLIGYEDLPAWWRNNEHIMTGYRFIPLHASTGPIPLIKSAFTMHNETGESGFELFSPAADRHAQSTSTPILSRLSSYPS
ncbi:hypothetical protein P7C73_g6706, partial [Tremellales sp. Uapishka_1]